MTVKVRYFAAARELAGADGEELDVPGELSASELLAMLAERHPRLGGYVDRMRIAVNGELHGHQVVRDGDEVDILPPVAGGRDPYVVVRTEPLSLDECYREVAHAGAGGVCLFTGVVRDNADGKDVARLDYESHTELADKEMRRILAELEAEHPGIRLAATHRIGPLAIGDLAVVVAASAPHRAEAFEACRAAIDRIKETVPIWKKEWAPDGTANWVNLDGE